MLRRSRCRLVVVCLLAVVMLGASDASIAVQPAGAQDDLRVRLRAGAAGVQPCGVSGLGADDQASCRSRWHRAGATRRC